MYGRCCWQNFIVSCSSAFVKLRKVIIGFVMSVCLSVHMEKICFHETGFHEALYFCIFRKSDKKIQVSLKSYKNNGYVTEGLCTFVMIYITEFFLQREKFETKFVKKIKTSFNISYMFYTPTTLILSTYFHRYFICCKNVHMFYDFVVTRWDLAGFSVNSRVNFLIMLMCYLMKVS